MTRRPAPILWTFLAALLGAAPAAAQSVPWDDGRDPVSYFGALLKSARAEIATPPSVAAAPPAIPGAGLVIDATEIGVGKFHRYDNQVHPYPAGAWVDHISPSGDLSKTPIVFDDADGAVTIQFSNLEELLRAVVAAAQRKGEKVSVLNIHGHGLPGAMWYPKDEAQKDSAECDGWRQSAAAPDEVNYKQYYAPLSKGVITGIRRASQSGGSYGCTSGAAEWTEVAARIPGLKGFFADDAQIHVQSCVVGLGPVGDRFTKTVASLLLSGQQANVQTSLAYGLGDWSMPEGMGFWDYVDDAQLAHFNRLYPSDRRDREFRQKGAIRVAENRDGQWITRVIGDQEFMTAGKERPNVSVSFEGASYVMSDAAADAAPAGAAPRSVRIPGTTIQLARR